jgi:tetratricopeptide (TPR) repeat protein
LRALEVADSYFTEVSENTLLHEPGMELVRQSLLRKARDFYADFVHERRDDRRLDNELARSFYRLGLIDAELSQYKSAEGLLRDSLGRFDRLLDGPSADGRLRETRARLLNDLGRVERLLDRHDRALAAYGRALEAWQELARDTAGSRAAKEGLGRCLLGLGNVLRKLDRREEALKLYRRSLDYRRALAEADPDDENYRRDLALTWQSLAGVLSLLGRDREASEARRQSLATFRQLVQAHPTRCRYREDLAVEQYNEGHRLMLARALDPAAGCYAEAIAHFEFLVARHPAKLNYLSRLGDTLYNRAGCLHESAKRKPDDAEYRKARLALADAEYAKARLVREQLAKEQPAVPLYQVAYAQCLRGDGDRAQERGEKGAAAEAYRQARAVLEKAPPSPDGRYLLAVVLHKLALLASAGEADPLFDLALAEARGLVRENLLVEKASRLEGYILEDRKKARP